LHAVSAPFTYKQQRPNTASAQTSQSSYPSSSRRSLSIPHGINPPSPTSTTYQKAPTTPSTYQKPPAVIDLGKEDKGDERLGDFLTMLKQTDDTVSRRQFNSRVMI
jgi:hypothetical protein